MQFLNASRVKLLLKINVKNLLIFNQKSHKLIVFIVVRFLNKIKVKKEFGD